MNLQLCTISFRHQLISLEEIAQWTKSNGFQGIELWGVHAKNLRQLPSYNKGWLEGRGLYVSMISDYLPLAAPLDVGARKTKELCAIANSWGVKKLRTFAGDKASCDISSEQRIDWTRRLAELCEVAANYGVHIVVETHPNTLADTFDSTLQLVKEVNHHNLKINFDVIHVWEAGDDVQAAFNTLAPHIVHMHLKNISERSLLDVFAPANVYAPAGCRGGMVRVFEGEFDFTNFLSFVMQQTLVDWKNLDVSFEWFGPDVLQNLAIDQQLFAALKSQLSSAQCKNEELEPLVSAV